MRRSSLQREALGAEEHDFAAAWLIQPKWVVSCTLKSVGHSAADLAGPIAGDLDRVGRSIGCCDPMIAALAIVNGLELVTGNTTHDQRVQQLGYPLVLANWRI